MTIPTWEENLLQDYCFSILQWIKQQTVNLSAFYLHTSQSASKFSQKIKDNHWNTEGLNKTGD